jgi:hypothetical protein
MGQSCGAGPDRSVSRMGGGRRDRSATQKSRNSNCRNLPRNPQALVNRILGLRILFTLRMLPPLDVQELSVLCNSALGIRPRSASLMSLDRRPSDATPHGKGSNGATLETSTFVHQFSGARSSLRNQTRWVIPRPGLHLHTWSYVIQHDSCNPELASSVAKVDLTRSPTSHQEFTPRRQWFRRSLSTGVPRS